MKFSEYPKEIQLLIQLRVKEAGNEFNEDVFNSNPIAGASGGLFTWYRTPEYGEFWNQVIDKNNFTEFYKKYPKSTYKEQAPIKDRVIGNKFLVTGCHSCSGAFDPEFGKDYNIGAVVTLSKDDESHCPYFTIEGIDQRVCIWWSCLYPIDSKVSDESDELKPIGKNTNRFTQRPTNVKVGDKFVMVSNVDISGNLRDLSDYDLKLELVFELSSDDGSDCPYFKGRDSKGNPIKSKVLNWGWLAPLQTATSEVPQYYTSVPKNVKEGDRFKVIGNKRLSGTIRDFKTLSVYGVEMGVEVILQQLDGSECPYFKTVGEKVVQMIALDWGWLAPITESETKLNINTHGESTSSTSSNVCRPSELDIRSGERYTGQVSCEINLPEIRSRY